MKNNELIFITSILTITGLEDEKFVKSQNGYIGGVKVPGIDLFNLKSSDLQHAISSFGDAIAKVDIPVKYVFAGCKPDYSSQKINLARHELKQLNPFRKYLLERERAWLEHYEKNQEERLVFVLFFEESKAVIEDAINKFIGSLSQAKMTASVCGRNELKTAFKILLQGGI